MIHYVFLSFIFSTLLTKTLFGDNGSGMTCSRSILCNLSCFSFALPGSRKRSKAFSASECQSRMAIQRSRIGMP